MLILTVPPGGGAAGLDAMGAAAAGWPGPCVLVAPPGHGLRPRDLRAAEAGWWVFEWLSEPPGAAALVPRIVVRLQHLLRDASWPLLYAAGPVAPAEAAGARARSEARPRSVEARLADGRASRLLVGEGVMRHPLAPDLFAFFAAREAPDERFVRLVAATLGEAGGEAGGEAVGGEVVGGEAGGRPTDGAGARREDRAGA